MAGFILETRRHTEQTERPETGEMRLDASLEGGGVGAAGWRRRLGEGAIDDLIEGVDGFLLARTATKNEDLGDEVILGVVGGVWAVRGGFPF
jgi:hypothetical protein